MKKKHTKKKEKGGFSLINMFGLKEMKKSETLTFVIGLLLLFCAVFMTLSFISYFTTGKQDQSVLESLRYHYPEAEKMVIHNSMGSLGARTAHYFIDGCFGIPVFFIPILLILLALRMMRTYRFNFWRNFIHLGFLMIWASIALEFLRLQGVFGNLFFRPGGGHGQFICHELTSMLGSIGMFMVLVVTLILYLIYLSHRTIVIINNLMKGKYFAFIKIPNFIKRLAQNEENTEAVEEATTDENEDKDEPAEVIPPFVEEKEEEDVPEPAETVVNEDKDFEVTTGNANDEAEGLTVANEKYDHTLDLELYEFPPLSLLKKFDNQTNIDQQEQQANKNRITQILHNFGVEISSIKATVGPTITLYEITPAVGVKISRIKNLEDDIALSLSAIGIRIIAPIPGKGTIGIEVPNKKAQIVSAESIFNSKKFEVSDYDLPIALGKTITNDIYMVDLAKMPHLLVAGATGMGKSVGLNIIITSLLYKKHPTELKLVLIDPKKVEFSMYAPLDKYFIARVDDGSDDIIITDVTKVKKTLNSLCKEMDDRYLLLKKAKARNIKEYNEKFSNRHLNPENGHRYLPYIVVIIDEFGDLIMTAGKEVELPIARIAQLARAVGIHMVIATQRPTTNIITGTIKANFPARMAFRVLAMIDSRTILDRPGANQLIGRGDMLFLANGTNIERVQCAYIDTPEVEAINEFIAGQRLCPQPYLLPEVADESSGGGNGDMSNGNLDSMFEEVARLIVAEQNGSTSLIQRKFSIGFNRAGRLMDQLECAGIVGPTRGSKPREVYVRDEMQLNEILQKLK
ncbi:MAG: DNA translocase FtsK 4TM domain-containing protein [Bacteroidaceae bacterium]|nr:DNA translocase FtsK 4TM domain-containing protein [Bacteroidaceae bacterium]